MARTPQVSRTFKTTEVDVLCYDLDKSEAVSIVVMLSLLSLFK